MKLRALSEALNCARKRAFPDEAAARRALRAMKHQRSREQGKKHRDRVFSRPVNYDVYRCPHCGFWHIGSVAG